MKSKFRKKTLVDPSLQLRLIFVFIFVSCITLVIQAAIFNFTIDSVAEKMPREGEILLAEWPSVLMRNVIFGILVLVPLTMAIGVHATFRVVGPLYRFRVYLKAVLKGEHPRPCKIRGADELQDLCDLINDATKHLREDTTDESFSDPTPSLSEAA